MKKIKRYDSVVQTPFKKLGLTLENDCVEHIQFLDADAEHKQSLDIELLQATAQIKQYCYDPAMRFTFAVKLNGTDFQQRVWHAISDIPLGEVRTYTELAEQLDTSPRAIGSACAQNPLPVVIPCHRVVAQHDFGGYCGETLESTPRGLIRVKGWLLLHEGVLKAQMNGQDVEL